jgi:BirA family biotin operon repressor/biotin-[acetyl-CoA-carboxylase] ligase
MTLDIDRLLSETFVARVEHHPVLGSTNDRAKECAADAVGPLPLLIVADQQTAGRGRGAHRWWTGPGSLAFSLVLDGRAWRADAGLGPLVSLVAAVAVSHAVIPLLPGHVVGIHWPNDVFAAGRKLAGILVEVLPGGLYVVGVGLNLNNSMLEAPAELRSIAASVLDLAAARHEPTLILVALLQRLASLVGHLPAAPAKISQMADGLCLQRGKVLSVQCGRKTVRGTCCGIAADGGLLLDTIHGREKIVSGVVTASYDRTKQAE